MLQRSKKAKHSDRVKQEEENNEGSEIDDSNKNEEREQESMWLTQFPQQNKNVMAKPNRKRNSSDLLHSMFYDSASEEKEFSAHVAEDDEEKKVDNEVGDEENQDPERIPREIREIFNQLWENASESNKENQGGEDKAENIESPAEGRGEGEEEKEAKGSNEKESESESEDISGEKMEHNDNDNEDKENTTETCNKRNNPTEEAPSVDLGKSPDFFSPRTQFVGK